MEATIVWRAFRWLGDLCGRLYSAEPGRRGDALARMSTKEAPAGTAEEVIKEGLRTLWIDRDGCSESTEERQVGSPVAGPPSCLTVCKQLQHHGGNPKLWMHLWMKEVGSAARTACTTKCRPW